MTGCSVFNSSVGDASDRSFIFSIAQQGMQVADCSDFNTLTDNAADEQVVQISIAQQISRGCK